MHPSIFYVSFCTSSKCLNTFDIISIFYLPRRDALPISFWFWGALPERRGWLFIPICNLHPHPRRSLIKMSSKLVPPGRDALDEMTSRAAISQPWTSAGNLFTGCFLSSPFPLLPSFPSADTLWKKGPVLRNPRNGILIKNNRQSLRTEMDSYSTVPNCLLREKRPRRRALMQAGKINFSDLKIIAFGLCQFPVFQVLKNLARRYNLFLISLLCMVLDIFF